MIRVRGFAALAAAGLLAGCANGATDSLPLAGHNHSSAASPAAVSQFASQTRFLYVSTFDGPPGQGSVLVYTAGFQNPHLLRTISNDFTSRPVGLWVDSKNNLWVANIPNAYPHSTVDAFKPGASNPYFTITTFKGLPQSVAVDGNGNVYVNENVQDRGVVQVYRPGSASPFATIDTGIAGYAFEGGGIAFDPKGNVFVAESARLQLHVVEIPAGTSKVVPVNLNLTNIDGPGLAIDAAGNLYVGNSQGGTVSVFAPGQAQPVRSISAAAYGLTAVTAHGNLYQASGSYYVEEIPAGQSRPVTVLNCSCDAMSTAVSH